MWLSAYTCVVHVYVPVYLLRTYVCSAPAREQSVSVCICAWLPCVCGFVLVASQACACVRQCVLACGAYTGEYKHSSPVHTCICVFDDIVRVRI